MKDLPDITVERGQLATASNEAATATEVEMVCRQFGADDVEIQQDWENAHVDVRVAGISAEDRQHLCLELRESMPPSTAVEVSTLDGGEDYVGGSEDRDVLTDAEMFTVLTALPDNWKDDRHLDLSDADMETLRPLMHEHGGLVPLLEKVEQSVADGPEQSAESIQIQNESTIFDGDEAAENDAEDREMGPMEKAKAAYVRGDIGEHEMEQRVEDALAETMDEGIPVPETP